MGPLLRLHLGMARIPLLALLVTALSSCSSPDEGEPNPAMAVVPPRDFELRAGQPVPDIPGERFFRNVRKLTFGGQNAEAYFSADGTSLVLQRTLPPGVPCDQIFVLDLATGEERLVSTGDGRTTCGFFMQGDRRILFSSTHLGSEDCPPEARFVQGRYVWPIYETYDIFTSNPDGSDLRRLTETPGYDAEATVCPITGQIVFTSMRDGDLELYSMEPDGSHVRRLTNRLGYDGGAFYSHDGSKMVLRSSFPVNQQEEQEYLDFLSQGLVLPTVMELVVMGREGEDFRQITSNGKANFAPYWLPDNERIIFASNMSDPQGRDFDLYLIREDGSELERVTFNDTFDSFPMFSPDGRYLVFASNRFGSEEGETNVFIAEWVEG